ncbi:hypothetical protein G6F32_016442 [Rhizopus arrhizus]|nr:hypothetical protein G6F32_016442 [Rhizopus arrhizus]
MNEPAAGACASSAKSGAGCAALAAWARLPASLWRRMIHSATGPPTTPPSTRPSVAEVIASAITAWILLKSANRGA